MSVVSHENMATRCFHGIEYLLGAQGAKLQVTLMKFGAEQTVRPHSHVQEQAGYCLDGAYVLTIDDEEHRIGAGDTYVIPAGAVHSYRILSDAHAVEVFCPPRPGGG